MDVLWRQEFNSPETHFRDFFETWLRVAFNISQAGRPVVFFGSGAGVPDNIEPCTRRRYFCTIEYLALVCDDEVLAERLRQRPDWRATHAPQFIEEQQRFNQWFKAYGPAQPAITLLDTTHVEPEEAARQVTDWITARLKT